jgi:hypothetical protein
MLNDVHDRPTCFVVSKYVAEVAKNVVGKHLLDRGVDVELVPPPQSRDEHLTGDSRIEIAWANIISLDQE